LRQELGFDPREKAEELTAIHDDDKRSAKRVLNVLTGGDVQREQQWLANADLDVLRRRGQQTGLADYLDELVERFVPLFGGSNPTS
jgi:hypothetical protein